MPANLGLVANAADADSLELAPQSTGDRATEAGLSDPGGTDEAEDRPRRIGLQLAHRQVLEDAVLDLLQVVVVGVEDLAGVGDIEVVLGLFRPGQLDQPLEVGADHAMLGGGGGQLLQPRQLALSGLLGVLWELCLLDPLAQLVHLGLLLVALPQLVLNRFQLLAKEELALAFVDLRLHLGLDLSAELDHLELAGEDLREVAQPLGHIDLLQQLLLLLDRDAQGAGDQMAERGGVVEVGDRHLQLLGQVGNLLNDLRERALHISGQRLQLGAGLDHVRLLGDSRDEVGLFGDVGAELHALGSLHEDADRAVGDFEHAGDNADHADLVEVFGVRLFVLGVTRRDHHQHPVGAEHVVDKLDRALDAHRQRRQGVRKGDHLAQRQYGQRIRQRLVGANCVLDVIRRLNDLKYRRALHHSRPIGTRRVVSSGSRKGRSMRRMPSS